MASKPPSISSISSWATDQIFRHFGTFNYIRTDITTVHFQIKKTNKTPNPIQIPADSRRRGSSADPPHWTPPRCVCPALPPPGPLSPPRRSRRGLAGELPWRCRGEDLGPDLWSVAKRVKSCQPKSTTGDIMRHLHSTWHLRDFGWISRFQRYICQCLLEKHEWMLTSLPSK